ncbi:MAG: hypothetical protein AAF198_03920 [Pseudomonadota bacterium]
MNLTKLAISSGIYTGTLISDQADPEVDLCHSGNKIASATIKKARKRNHYNLSVEIPNDQIDDGITVLSLINAKDHALMDTITIVAGDISDDLLAAKVEQLEAELNLVKQAVRRLHLKV